jgi:hypothetical protein
VPAREREGFHGFYGEDKEKKGIAAMRGSMA